MLKRELTQEEVNATYQLVQEYLQQRKERKQPTDYDILTSQDQLLAIFHSQILRKKALEIEPDITKDLLELESLGIGSLKSLENRVKPFSSILSKISTDSLVDYKGSLQRAALNLCDVVRYTFVINDEEYLDKMDECLHMLEDLGYQVVEFKNNWGHAKFKGVNVRCVDKNKDYIFEIQFHTPLAYRIKEGDESSTKENSTRSLYKVATDRNAPEWLRVKADRLRIYLQTFIKIPDGALEYRYDPDVKRR